ncbi:hypothetical protein SAMN05216212_1918 [Microbulbifer yueqingensis]|uniref:Uncharacterized protein n=1 Tax=Microbulbifer yueqingensis TaxID=658219 RepID=A0A1G9AAG7_9GAMM|nr:hypothetical protein SAMN05216212_1918 [Microbulbifer yueqingensis]
MYMADRRARTPVRQIGRTADLDAGAKRRRPKGEGQGWPESVPLQEPQSAWKSAGESGAFLYMADRRATKLSGTVLDAEGARRFRSRVGDPGENGAVL